MTAQAPKVKSADRVMDILELFMGDQQEFNLTEIATILGIPSSSTYLILQNMAARGYLEADRTGKLFHLGHKIFEIRSRYLKKVGLTAGFEAVAQGIADQINESVMLGIRGGDQVEYISQINPQNPRRYLAAHTSLPLYACASGKMILSDYSDEEIRNMYPDEELEPLTSRTLPNVTMLLRELEAVRREAIAFNRSESVEGISCVACPIYNSAGSIAAAVSVSIPDFRRTDELWSETVELLRDGSRQISHSVYGNN